MSETGPSGASPPEEQPSQARTRRGLQAVLDHCDGPIYVKDIDGRFLLANDRLHRMTGRAPGSLIGRTGHQVLPDELADELAALDAGTLRTGRGSTEAESFPHPDGTSHEYLVSRFPITGEGGAIWAVGSIGLDVSTLRRAEQEVADSERRWSTVVENSPLGVLVVGPEDLVLLYANEQAARMCGAHGPAALLGRRLLDFVAEISAALCEQRIPVVQDGAPLLDARIELLGPDGLPRQASLNAAGTVWQGHPAVQLTLQDVTERAQGEERLLASEAKLHALFDQGPVGQMELALDGRILDANRRLENMLGYEPGTLAGRRIADLVPPVDRPGKARDLAGLAGGQLAHYEAERRYRCRGGGYLPVFVSAGLVRNAQGEPVRLSAIVVDDSDRAAAREALLRSQRMLAASQQQARLGSYEADLRRDEVTCSPELLRLAGLRGDPAGTLGMDEFVKAVAPGEQDLLRQRWSADATSRLAEENEFRLLQPDGTERLVRHWSEVQLDSTGQPQGVLGTVQDITETRRAERDIREARDLFGSVLTSATEQAIIALDMAGRVTVWNTGAARMFGWSAEEMLGEVPSRVLGAGHIEQAAAAVGVEPTFEGLFGLWTRQRTPVAEELSVETKSGARIRIALSGQLMGDREQLSGAMMVCVDVTDRVRMQRELRSSEQRFRLAFDNAPIGMAIVDLIGPQPGVMLKVNRALCDLLGYATDELVGAEVASITHPEDFTAAGDKMEQLARGEREVFRRETRYRHAGGHDVWALLSASVVRDEEGDPLYCVIQVEDITARKLAEAELTHQALHDNLTGLPNRVLLMDHLNQALARAERSGASVGVLYLDVDNFKEINDSLGHAAGDVLLVEIAKRLVSCLRETDTAARLGGDEFVIVCEDLATPSDATTVARRVEKAMVREVEVEGHSLKVSASVGIATTGPDLTTADALLRDADAAMYRAKEGGRGRYAVADAQLHARALRQIEIEEQLRAAVAAAEESMAQRGTGVLAEAEGPGLRLHYQPSYDLNSGDLVAVEALLRWQHPTRGLLRPGEFLDVAEDRDLIARLGAWVLRQACGVVAGWVDRFEGRAPDLWVNISARQLAKHELAAQVRYALSSTHLAAGHLCLEITERQLLGTTPAVGSDLEDVAGLGVGLAIDDFGTGYAGLDYLRRYPFGILKIDRSFVAGLGVDRTGTALTSSVINLGRTLDLTTVGEGVETAEQRDQLRDLGCTQAQGYLLQAPAPAATIEGLLAAGAMG